MSSGGAKKKTSRLRRSDCAGAGLHRLRHGHGFRYVDDSGRRIGDAQTIQRIRALAIPPAWRDVWICRDPQGHLQATGVDAAGRKQYRYHDAWRRHRDREKFRRMVEFGEALPRLRRAVVHDLAGRGLGRERVLACAVRLLDVGLFRVGGEEYADEGGGLGLATLRKRHVAIREGVLRFDYPAKSGVRRLQDVDDPDCVRVVKALRARRGGGTTLLAYHDGNRWIGVRAEDINAYIKERTGDDFSAKDFRTWNATVLAAVLLANDRDLKGTDGARKRAVDAAVRGVSEALGNTPAVARRAYIDPHVFDRYRSGWTVAPALPASGTGGPRVRGRVEAAVIDLLTGETASPAVGRRSG
jgi:DNA topoisomerase IB